MKGTVTLNLEFESRTLKLDVSPEAYRIIDMFKTKGKIECLFGGLETN